MNGKNLVAESRDLKGKNNNNRLRADGYIPAVVYSHGESEAIKIKEQAVVVRQKDIIMQEDESYSIGTLLDCFVYDIITGEKIGKMKDVYLLPGNDVWIVDTPCGELPIPFIEDVVKNIDLEKARIEIVMIDGLKELISRDKDD